MKIEIENTGGNSCYWTVRMGDRWEDHLGFDEALGTVSRIMLGAPITYLKTAAEHEAMERMLKLKPLDEIAAHQKLLEDRSAQEAEDIFPNVRIGH